MKYYIPIVLLFFGSLNAQKKIEPDDYKLIRGKWVSFEDKHYKITISDSTFIEYYDKDKPEIFKYKIENDILKKTGADGDIYEYEISSLSDTNLTLMYLPRGNFLMFEKIKSRKTKSKK